jgi:hypothetical protein
MNRTQQSAKADFVAARRLGAQIDLSINTDRSSWKAKTNHA